MLTSWETGKLVLQLIFSLHLLWIVIQELSCFGVVHVKSLMKQIRYLSMLVATGSFSPERGVPVNFCVAFNHFQSIVMSALVHSKTLKCSFLTTLGCSFTGYQQKYDLLKSSLGICHLKWLKCTENWTGSPLLYMLLPGDLALRKVVNRAMKPSVVRN